MILKKAENMTAASPEVLEIWNAYPRRVKKPAALRAILKAIGRDGYEQVLWRTQEYAKCAAGRDLQFIPHPSTFFNQQMYLDDLEALLPKPKINGHKVLSVLDLKSIITAKENEAQKLKNKFSSEVAMGRTWSDDVARARHREIRQEIATLNTQLANRA